MISELSHHHVIAFTYSKYCLESENMLLYEFEASKYGKCIQFYLKQLKKLKSVNVGPSQIHRQ